MTKIGIFFGTDTGTTRKISKLIYRELGDEFADKPVNINRVSVDDLMSYDTLILGTPTYGAGELPGLSAECETESWEEFMPNFEEMDLSGKTIALFGLGDQVNYPEEFVDALGELYDVVVEAGASTVGQWATDGYEYQNSTAEEDGEFVGLVLDNDNQADLHAQRISQWVSNLKQELDLPEAA